MQHVEDGEADVEADEVGERQRSHRVVHAELHHRVDRLGRADAFHHREDRLVDHRHQDAVGDEARDSRPLRPASCRAPRTAPTRSASTRPTSPARESARRASSAAPGFMKCMPSTRSGRFVAAPSSVIEIDDVFDARIDVGPRDRVEAREERALGVGVLDDRFDDVVGVGERVERRRGRQPAERRVAIGGGQLALLDELREALLDRRRARDRASAARRRRAARRSPPARTPGRCRCPSCPRRRRRSS